MSQFLSKSVVALALAGTPAVADVTPQDVLGMLEENAASMDVQFTLTRQRQNGTDIEADGFKYVFDEDDLKLTVSGGALAIRADGDAVNVEWPDVTEIEMQLGNGDTIVLELIYDTPTHRLFETENAPTPDMLSYVHTANSMTVRLSEITSSANERAPINFDLTLEDVEMVGDVAPSGSQNFVLSAARWIQDAALTDANGSSMGSVGEYVDIELAGNFSGPFVEGLVDLPGPDDVVQLAMSQGGGFGTSTMMGPNGPVAYQIRMDGASVDFDLSEGKFDFGFDYDGLDVDAQIAALPIPGLGISVGGFDGRLHGPFTATDGADAFGLTMNWNDLALSDAVWTLFDSGGLLPRDPAQLSLDVSGMISLLEGFDGAPVPDLTNEEIVLTLNGFDLSALGASLTAEGEIAPEFVDGVPVPVGEGLVELNGANTLMRSLSDMGLVASEQLLPLRMMMGIFMVPGDEPDSFVSEIDFGADGVLSANGVPLQ